MDQEDTSLSLVPDSYLDDYDDEIGKPITQDLDDGAVKILSLDEIKNMKTLPDKPRKVPSYLKKKQNYDSKAFKESLHRSN